MSQEKIIKIIRDSHSLAKKLDIPHWFLGGIAIAAYAHGKLVRKHDDVDLYLQFSPEKNEAELFKRELVKRGYRIDPSPPHPGLISTRAWLGKTHFLDFAIGHSSPKGGLNLPLYDGVLHLPAEALNSKGTELAKVDKIPLLSPEALFILKDRGWAMRPKDKVDIKILQQAINSKKVKQLKEKGFGAHFGWKTLIRYKRGQIITKLHTLIPKKIL